MQQQFNTVLQNVVTSNNKIIPLLFHNYNFDTVMNYNVTTQYTGYLTCSP
jgi:predicted nucleotide-binding protein (sugar kinase/HSP70/actin superfamily)